MQHPAGSWHAYYDGDAVKEHTLDTNVTCYIANGVWHHYLATGDTGFLDELFPVVERAIDFALDNQHPTGEIEWDADPIASTARARCSPVRRASTRRCAARSRPPNGSAATAPTGSSRSARSPSRSRTVPSASSTRNAGRWTGTTRSSPACCAATRPRRASRRSGTRSSRAGRGVRCVSDQPWITAAETCELVMALDAIGLHDRARELFALGAVPAPRRRQLLDRHELRRRAASTSSATTTRPSSRRGTAPRSCSRPTRSAAPGPTAGTVPRRGPPGGLDRAGADRRGRRDRSGACGARAALSSRLRGFTGPPRPAGSACTRSRRSTTRGRAGSTGRERSGVRPGRSERPAGPRSAPCAWRRDRSRTR